MAARVDSAAPEDLTVVEGADPIAVTFVTDEAPTGRVLEVTVNAVSVLHWAAGVATVASGYAADVLLGYRSMTVRLTRTGGWVSGLAVAWQAAYTDDATASVVAEGRFVRATFTPARRVPAAEARGTSRRVEIFRSYDVSAGSPRGVDLFVDGQPAVTNEEVARPNFTGATASAGSRAYVTVTRRRDYRWGQRVTILAHPRIDVSGLIYRGRDETSFVVTGKPGTGQSVIVNVDRWPPIAQAVQQMISATFRPRPESPNPKNAAIHFVLRSTMGSLLRASYRDVAVIPPAPEDIPSDRAILQFLQDYAPLRRTFVELVASPEDREAVEEAWKSGHPVEQLASVLYLLLVLTQRDEVQNPGGG